MATINLLYQHEFKINDHISVVIPTVGEILNDENTYDAVVSAFTAMPIDMIVPLDNAGIDFTTITAWDLFIMTFDSIKQCDTSLVLGDLDLNAFEPGINTITNMIELRDVSTGTVIDRAVHDRIATVLRTIHNLKKDTRRPANKEAKEYMIQRAHEKAKRNKRRKDVSQIESLIVSMVNSEQFKYNFESVRDMTIYQFKQSVRQVVRKNDYNNLMYGVYAGTVNVKELSHEALDWLTPKK